MYAYIDWIAVSVHKNALQSLKRGEFKWCVLAYRNGVLWKETWLVSAISEWEVGIYVKDKDEENLKCLSRICTRSLHEFMAGRSVLPGGSSAELFNGFRLNWVLMVLLQKLVGWGIQYLFDRLSITAALHEGQRFFIYCHKTVDFKWVFCLRCGTTTFGSGSCRYIMRKSIYR
jgi:hypothetical protein